MERCDVLVVGGGPAGASCARVLAAAGRDVVVLDRATFPRDKACAGWVTLPVFRALGINPTAYGRDRTLQPFTGFRVGALGGRLVETRYAEVVSYGIRRAEFDDFLLTRSGARLRLGEPLASLERSGGRWTANGRLEAPVVVGAGGHFCPTRRLLGVERRGEVVVAQEGEVELGPADAARCPVAPDTPELYFCPDLRGYGWCVRKGNRLNVGLGRTGEHDVRRHVGAFLDELRREGRLPEGLRIPLRGHAYELRRGAVAPAAADGILWIGDAAGLADPKSGEGIGPAVESGLLAARRILGAAGEYRKERLDPGHLTQPSARAPALPAPLRSFAARKLLGTRWFTRRVVLDRWFLHRGGETAGDSPTDRA